ncbi:argininosuccinate lyase [Salarchaeum sp. JOR-1]|uniref:argininosuccinate lyase n=1 Tax=Salarchaeum sp. JOR-1 TaxID=2599399 RepID=UPI001198844F|nr:argininosuccinate lyase [Salarchaeum sp. JOR-1]QDX40237.1 argininosuccinate lyase [Salarchaeum sp. JOR-1]
MNGGEDSPAVRRERFSGGPAREFLSSMDADSRIFGADLAVDRAHVAMLAEQDVIEASAAASILDALDDVESAGFDALPDGEDVHEAIETAVIDRVGPVGGKMHTARSRNDEVATCIRYRFRDDLLDAAETTIAFREALVEAAAEHAETVMPGYTHLQPAQPVTVAHFLLSYESAVARDTERLLDAYARTNRSPLGAAAFGGTPFDIDRERTAGLLGFDSVIENSMDASSTRDFLVEGVSALAALATTVSGLAEDLVVFSNKGLVSLSDDYSSTSSIMPQKKNPDTLELVRATAGDAAGALQGLLTTLKGLPRAYNRDLQSATGYGWTAVDEVTEAVAVAAGAVATAEWPADALADAAGEGFSTATGVADTLAMAGLPFRTAHEIVAEAGTGDIAALDDAALDVTGESLADLADVEAVEAALDPAASVAMRDSFGGPAPDAVAGALDRAADGVDADVDAVDERRDALADAADDLAAEVASYE